MKWVNFVHDWLVTSKMIKNFFTALYADEHIFYFNEDSGNVVFNCNEMGILNKDLIELTLTIKILMKMT